MGFFEDLIAECREAEADEIADALAERPVLQRTSEYSALNAYGYRPLLGPAAGDDLLQEWPEKYAALCLRDHLDGGALRPEYTPDPLDTEWQGGEPQRPEYTDPYGNAYPPVTSILPRLGQRPAVALRWRRR